MSECIDAIRDRAWKARPPSFGNVGRRDVYTFDRNEDLELSEVTRVPTLTLAGEIWIHTVKIPRKGRGEASFDVCSLCPLEGRCREAVARGDFIACEKPLRKEII